MNSIPNGNGRPTSWEINQETNCWKCISHHMIDGYPCTARGGTSGGRYNRVFISHIMYELYNGPVGNLLVLHRCDNRQCINPEHLFLGTHLDNAIDRHAKGRTITKNPFIKGFEIHIKACVLSRIARISQGKLSPSQVRSIRSDPRTHRIIGLDFGISCTMVLNIKHFRRYGHVE